MVKVYIALFTLGKISESLTIAKLVARVKHCSCILLGTNIVLLPRRAASYALEILFATASSSFSFFVLLLYKLILRLDELLWERRALSSPAAPSPLDLCFSPALIWTDCAGARQESARPKPSYLDSSCENDYLFKVV